MEQKVSDKKDALEDSLADHGVKFLMASFADMHGVSKTKMVPLSHIDQMLQRAVDLEIDFHVNRFAKHPFTTTSQAPPADRLFAGKGRVVCQRGFQGRLPMRLLDHPKGNAGVGVEFLELQIPSQVQLVAILRLKVAHHTLDHVAAQQGDQNRRPVQGDGCKKQDEASDQRHLLQ